MSAITDAGRHIIEDAATSRLITETQAGHLERCLGQWARIIDCAIRGVPTSPGAPVETVEDLRALWQLLDHAAEPPYGQVEWRARLVMLNTATRTQGVLW